MRITRLVSFWTMTALVLIMAVSASAQTTLPIKEDKVIYEFIGEYINSPTVSGPNNLQFGYLSSIAGLDDVFSGAPKNETTALFTFVVNAVTYQVVSHGPFRIVDRTGTTTIYLNNGPSDFANPASFSQGTPIQVSSYRQTVITNTLTNTFVSVNTHTITSVETFTLDGVDYRLGQMGKTYHTDYSGQINAPGGIATNSGWIASIATGSKN
jgi:hypothetical protein